MAGYTVLMCAECAHEETGKEKSIDFFVRFKDENDWADHHDDDFDTIKDDINAYLQENGHKGWFIDGVVETDRNAKAGEALNPLVL